MSVGTQTATDTMESTVDVPQKMVLKLQYDSAIPLLDIYSREMKSLSQRDTCAAVFTDALFTVAKKWKQPLCLSTDE